MKDPVLARAPYKGYMTIKAIGGLHYIKGNPKPHFSLTGEVINPRRRGERGGCIHEEIMAAFPHLSDMVAMHLSDIDGVPMHVEGNGWYFLSGALPNNADERYSMGNSKGNYGGQYRYPTHEECLTVFACHARISMEDAAKLRDAIVDVALLGMATRQKASMDGLAATGVYKPYRVFDWKLARETFGKWIKEQYPRWKTEAEACIAKHGLIVYGDTYKPE